MRKILYILLPLAITLAACTQEIEIQNGTQDKDCITLKVFNSPMTKATDIGLDYERHLSRLDVFFYIEGQTDRNCVYYQAVTDPQYLTGSGEIPFYVVEEQINEIFPNGNKTCDVFVIANLPETKRTFDTDPQDGYANTEYNRLSALLLDMDDVDNAGEKLYDAIGKDFIMAGFDGNVTKDNNNNAAGTVKLVRAASKVTITVNVPEKIVLTEEGAESVTMVPVFEEIGQDGVKRVSLKTSFHNGVSKGYLYPAGVVDRDMSVIPESALFESEEVRYTYVKEIPAEGANGVKKYQFACDIPFYSYESVWQKGEDRAVYLSFELPWKNADENEYHPYYYQILVNGGGRRLEPNRWYDLIVNVGVIGSSVRLEPVELTDMSIYVLDWTTEPDPEDAAGGDRYEDLAIEQYTYFSVPQKRIEMNNTTVGTLNFDASHSVKWKLEWPTDEDIQATFDEMEKDYHTGNVAAYYVNCGGSNPEQRDLSRFIQDADFTLSALGNSLTFNYPEAEIDEYNEKQDSNANKYNIYSPVYVHVKLWLDINGDGEISTDINEDEYVEYVTFVYYPAMYIEPDQSHPYSVYVNNRQTQPGTSYDIKYGSHDLGCVPGHSGNSWDNQPSYMYTVTVSSFKAENKFKAHDGEMYPYIIGDPRERVSDIEMDDNANATVATNWVGEDDNIYGVQYDANGNIVRDANGEIQYVKRTLQYYYPTSSSGNSFQIVSPKFKVVSFFSSGWTNITSKGAEMRCATFQEDGYPAGRWRLPTEAEIMFIIDLQKSDVISDIFYGGSQYYSATEINNTTRYKISYPKNGTPSWTSGSTGSVRCVYDEWYWGSEREAQENSSWNGSHTTRGQNEYLFTWGDKQIWPE